MAMLSQPDMKRTKMGARQTTDVFQVSTRPRMTEPTRLMLLTTTCARTRPVAAPTLAGWLDTAALMAPLACSSASKNPISCRIKEEKPSFLSLRITCSDAVSRKKLPIMTMTRSASARMRNHSAHRLVSLRSRWLSFSMESELTAPPVSQPAMGKLAPVATDPKRPMENQNF